MLAAISFQGSIVCVITLNDMLAAISFQGSIVCVITPILLAMLVAATTSLNLLSSAKDPENLRPLRCH